MYFNIGIIFLCIIIYVILSIIKKIPADLKNKIFLALIFIIICFLMATRTYGTGSDTEMYVRKFQEFCQAKWNSQIFGGYYEPLYVITNILLSYISSNPRILIVVTSIFISFAFYKFIQDNSKDYLSSIIMFIGVLLFYGAMNTIRQYIAISIILLGFKFVKEKKLLPYMLMVVLAYLFHSTALIGIFIYLIYNAKYKHTRVILIFIVAIIANIFILDLINIICGIIGRPNYYVHRVGLKNIANLIYVFMYLCLYLLSILLMKKNKLKDYKQNGNNNFYLYTFVMSSAFSIIAMRMNVLARITLYFNVFSIICLPNVIMENIKVESKKLVARIALILVFTTYSCIIIKYRPQWNTAYNYKNCFIDKETVILDK